MGGTLWLIGRGLRRRWPGLVPVAIVVGLGAGGALVALGAGDRTDSAYPSYLERADVGELVINPSVLTAEIDEVIRSLPGVRDATSDTLFLATLDDGRPRPAFELDAQLTQPVRGSVDRRYSAMDRPVLTAGRYPTGRDEALVSVELADARKVEVGDTLPVSFWSTRNSNLTSSGRLRDPAAVISPIAVERVEVVGIATLADEVLADGVYPRERIIVSPAMTARYDCLPSTPRREATYEEAVAQLNPEGCAALYQYYSLSIAGGDAALAAAQVSLAREVRELNDALPDALRDGRDQLLEYAPIVTTTRHEQERVDRSVRPAVAAMFVLGTAAAAATVILTALAIARELRRVERDHRMWWQLGMTTLDRMRVVVAPLLLAVAVGLVVALVLAWVLSPVGPIGSVRSVDPTPARELSRWVLLGALALAFVLVAAVAVLAYRSVRWVGVERETDRAVVPIVQRMVRGTNRPEVAEGIRAAYTGRGASLVFATAGVGAAAFIAAMVFASSVSVLLSTPRSYGWPWDIAMMGGFGYGGLDLDAVEQGLDDRAEVEGWTGLGFTTVTMEGEPVVAVVALDQRDDVDLTVVEGRLPVGEHEVAVGTRTAREGGIVVGDEVALAGDDLERRDARVTALVVLPSLGPYQADRAAPGTGVLLPAAMYDRSLVAGSIAFIGVDLATGSRPDVALDALRADFGAWTTIGYEPLEYADAIRPPEILDTESMRAVPLIVVGLLVATTIVGLAFAVVVSVRARRRDLAILRALGFTGRQVRRSVRAQSVASLVAALLVGLPIGILLGRVAWRAFASQLGVVTDVSYPGAWILVAAVGALVVTSAAAAVPARRAASANAATLLRPE